MHRDIEAFNERAPDYEEGWRGQLHHDIADRTLAIARPHKPKRILDVGCGTGYFLRKLATALPDATALVGIDPAPNMIKVATAAISDDRVTLVTNVGAEHLPFDTTSFDMVVAITSFDHWSDQRAGLAECLRVLAPKGRLIIVDQFSPFLVPTLLWGRRGKARTKRRATHLLAHTGFQAITWQNVYASLIKAGIAKV